MPSLGEGHFMTDKQFEQLSALLDDEITSANDKQASVFETAVAQTERFSRYSLIGDVLRKEDVLVTDTQFADSIMDALTHIEQDTAQSQTNQVDNSKVVALDKHPAWLARLAKAGVNWSGKVTAQVAIAASVALLAVVGVNNLTVETNKSMSPVINTVPLVNGLAPVSLNSDQNGQTMNANQVTQERINALIADHNQQTRTRSDVSETKKVDEADDNEQQK
jgi:sigma-E factor negative regulatory protein RseA